MIAPTTKHNLLFKSRQYPAFFEDEVWIEFNVGTVSGLWNVDDDNFIILSFINDDAGNGHLEDVFQWFEYFCSDTKKNLLIKEIVNKRFYNHLINKRGFVTTKKENQLIKHIKN